MCTPWAPDRVVGRPDWAGLRLFSGEWRIFKGWSPVRVPPRARCFRSSGACGPLSVHNLFTYGPLWGPIFVRGSCLLLRSGGCVARYLFGVGRIANCMT